MAPRYQIEASLIISLAYTGLTLLGFSIIPPCPKDRNGAAATLKAIAVL
jgi:hypothetical protein